MSPLIYPEPGETLNGLARRVMNVLPPEARPWVQLDTGGARVGLHVPYLPPAEPADGTPAEEGADGQGEIAAPQEAAAALHMPFAESHRSAAAPTKQGPSAPRSASARRAPRRRPSKEM